MKRLWVELQRWSRQRAVKCRNCEALDDVMRLRTPLAVYVAQEHERRRPGHVVVVAYFG